ncbi:phosphohistidine phosphatase [Malaciobacter molluscorum]|uniref:SixA phosphatase family protein n=1 Tax=Malaciobacter molluscorum TaxID=1032072 RepID=UPI00100A27EF|nr:histidine phosphatase family protein [Malaciobacter molluscorum]RXJ94893.1 phosphohistidine phosphatase [Malaciobacter molluscorum]
MKKLYLIRHAKSSWKNLTLSDFDRPLDKRGKVDAPLMAELLKEKEIKPDLIIASPAYRTRKTAQIIANRLGYDKKQIVYFESLYHATLETLIDAFKYLDDRYENVFLVGHNPSINYFAKEYLNFDKNIVTCSILEISMNCIIWQDIKKDNCKLLSYEYPKKYK